MEEKEKAIELYNRYFTELPLQVGKDLCVECAKIAVEEVIKELEELDIIMIYTIKWWKNVIVELDKL